MKRQSLLSIAAVAAASLLAWQAPQVLAAGYGGNASASQDQQGVPGVELNVGNNASDRGLPGVEMNVGREGDQQNLDTRTLGAGSDMRSDTGGSGETRSDGSTMRPLRADRG